VKNRVTDQPLELPRTRTHRQLCDFLFVFIDRARRRRYEPTRNVTPILNQAAMRYRRERSARR
jgi:hypothetical protein